MDAPLVSALDVGFAYGRRSALDGFSVDVGPGRIMLLLGLNGAGKSTALALLAGKTGPREGRIRICGGDPRRAASRRNLWLLEEVAAPAGHLTARESVGFYLDLYARRGSRKQTVEQVLTRVGLGEQARKRAGSFSKGMRRRLELACLLAVDPRVWLLDEPQTGLDPRGLRLLKRLCVEARERGRSVVMASHALSDVPALADEVHILSHGKTTFTGDREDLLEKVCAQGYVISGSDGSFDQALRALAARHGMTVEGPRVPSDPLEDLLFEQRDAES